MIGRSRHARVFRRFSDHTMVPADRYVDNLVLADRVRDVAGAVVECGVWRGGMIAGIASTLGRDRRYVLLDSFEGLPAAQPIDGPAAAAWQADDESDGYYDNCAADVSFATTAMTMAGIDDPDIRRGWFDETAPALAAQDVPIALLRLDGDWFESTSVCLRHLFPRLVDGGLLIIDDYGFWDGCTRAVHRYLAEQDRPESVERTAHGVAWLTKRAA